MKLKNKIVMPPMCMYSADESGKANEFHVNHYMTRAVGGVGLIIAYGRELLRNPYLYYRKPKNIRQRLIFQFSIKEHFKN